MKQGNVAWAWAMVLLVAFVGCSGDSASSGPAAGGSAVPKQTEAPSTPSADERRVLGFDDPVSSDWTSDLGKVSRSSVFEEGSSALSIRLPGGRTEVCSSKLSLPWKQNDSLSFQLWMREATESGEVQVVLRPAAPGTAPIALLSITLDEKQPAVFHTITSPVESEAHALNDTPVQICLVFNAEAGDYVIDDLRLTHATPSDAGATDTSRTARRTLVDRTATTYSIGDSGWPNLTSSASDSAPGDAFLAGPTADQPPTWPGDDAATGEGASSDSAAAADPKGDTGGPRVAFFELDDPDFCTTETLLNTAPFVSSVSPAPNGTTIPYPLCTAQQYAHLVVTSDLWASNFVLMADIDLGTLSPPPSTSTFVFTGVFEGNNKTFSNYTIASTGNAGVLGKLGLNGIIRNLELVDFDVSGVGMVGALVFDHRGLTEHITGTNLTVTGTSMSGNLGIGGLVGRNDGGTIVDVTASVDVLATSEAISVGGLVGRQSSGLIDGCVVSGNVTRTGTDTSKSVGGAVGALNSGSLSDCHSSVTVTSTGGGGGLVSSVGVEGIVVDSSSSGSVSGTDDPMGGLVASNAGRIEGCSSSSPVSGGPKVGGLVGAATTTSTIVGSSALASVQSTAAHAGGLVGHNRGRVEGSYATGTVQGVDMVGGLTGTSGEETALIRGSWANVTVTATGHYAGGLVGFIGAPVRVEASHARGDVTGTRFVGGLFGHSRATVVDSSATGANVTGRALVGGLAGKLEGVTQRCFATGNVFGLEQVGGFAGLLEQGSVSDGFATGSATAEEGQVGGLVGRMETGSSIVRAYAAGAVVSTDRRGGFVGNMTDGTFEDCHFNTTENPGLSAVGTHPSVPGIAANSEAALRQQATFTGWDFESVWGILEDSSYPFLQPVPPCAEGGCSLGCPCPATECTDEVDCALGQVCGEANGGYFDEEPDADVCWDPLCETDQRQLLCAAEGLPCGECPSEETGCLSDADCAAGEVCGEDNGGHFGRSKTTNACWPEGCSEDVFETGCGPDNAPCGLCYPIPKLCSDDADCAAGEVCGEGNGIDFGLAVSDRVCWPSRCEGTPDPSDTGSLSSPCGVGICRASCDGKQCGDLDGCGGYCPVCISHDFIDGGCVDDGQCMPGLECAPNGICASPACQDVAFFESNCGPVDLVAPCGRCLECEEGCGDSECGVDPRCGGQCGGGACADGLSCVAGQCVDSPVQVEPDPASTVGRLEGTFSVTPNGAASYTIPISVPPGRAGLAPNLSVVYTSDKQDGILGIGWKLAGLPYIARCPASRAQAPGRWGSPVALDGNDRFCIGEEILVVENAQSNYGEDGTYYRTERETFARFQSVGQEEVNGLYRGPASFRVQTKDGLEYVYGETDDASVFVLPRTNRVKRSWALNEIRDRSGNVIQVRYKDTYDPVDGGSETFELLPWSIRYSPDDREVRFSYEPRSEQRVQYTTGTRIYHTQRLASIQTLVGDRVTRSYEFQYEEPDLGNSLARPLLLKEARECVIEGQTRRCKTGTQFAYQNAHGLVATEPDLPFTDYPDAVMDVNGDGMDDVVDSGWLGIATGDRQAPFNKQTFPPFNWPPLDMADGMMTVLKRGLQSRVLDYDGDGTDEFVSGAYGDQGEQEPLSIYRWNGENFAEVYRAPDHGYGIATIKTVDLNGDGLKDVYLCGSEPGESERRMKFWLSERSGGAVSYSPLSRGEGFDPGDCMPETNLFLDVDGDGVANVVRHEVTSGDWYYLADLPNFNGRWLPLRISPRLEPTPNILFGNSALELVEPYEGDLAVYEPFGLRVANVNGDGLVDIIEYGLEAPITWTAFGGGFKYNTDPPMHPEDLFPASWSGADVVDYDGDGRDDLVINNHLYQGTDKGLVETSVDDVAVGPEAGLIGNPGLGNMVGDFDGDGTHDYLFQTKDPSPGVQRIDYGNTRTSFLLWVVTDGLGVEHEIRYDRLDPDGNATYSTVASACEGSDTYCIKKPPALVSAVQVWESRMFGGYEERVLQEFHYKDLRRGVDGRGSYGMGERIVTTYAPGGVFSSETREVYHNDSFELAGVLKTRETRTATLEPTRVATSHSRMVTEETDWEVRQSDAGRPFPFPKQTVSTMKDAGQEVVNTSVTRDADVFGNLISVNTSAGDPKVGDNISFIKRTVSTTNYEHESDPSLIEDWLIALPSRQTELAEREVAGGEQREMEFTYYDNGLLETATRLGEGSEYQQTQLVRDQYGNVESSIVRDAEGNERQEQVVYDSRGLFPQRIVNAEGEATNVRMNEALGSVDEITDVNSLTTRHYYDGFGRLTRTEDWRGDVDYIYSDPAFGPAGLDPVSDRDFAKQRVTVTTSHGARTYTDIDAFGRTVFTVSRGLFGTEVIQGFAYDWDGTLMAESRPHEDGDFSQGVVEHEYDAWRRPSATRFPDNTSIEYYYATAPTYVGSGVGLPTGGELFPLRRGLFATFLTKRGDTTTYTGLPIDGGIVTDHVGVALTTSDATGTLTDLRYSGHDALTMIDHVRGDTQPGNRTVIERDRWQRIRWIDDPDSGTSTYTYTGFDQVDTMTDAEDLVSDFDYDNAGRLIERRDTADGEILVTTWSYGDSALANNVGRVTETTSPDGVITEYFYKMDAEPAVGLPDRVVTSVPRTAGGSDVESFTLQYLYDSLKRVSGIVYPGVGEDSFSVQLGRDEQGNVTSVTDGTDSAMVYWEATSDYQGVLVSQERLGNGVYTNSTFEDSTGRVLGIQSQVGPQAYSPEDLLQDLAYDYYPDGLLEWQTDAALPAGLRSYEYDALDRVESETSSLGTRQYDYDQRGNLTLKDGKALTYERSAGLPVHSARTMGDNTYDYDGKGNQYLRTGPDVAGGRQLIRYTPFNLPKQVDTGPEASPDITTFDYDAAHTRTAKRSESATTLFIGGLYERVEPNDTSGERTHKYHVYAGGRRVAQVERTEDIAFESLGPPEYQFLSRDRLASVHTVTDVNGVVVEQRTYDPFGQPSDEPLSSNDIRAGFTGHEHDAELGLIDMGGRVYDAALGRFLTPDPLANVVDLQSLNRYSYVLNSPMNLVDPSGFQAGPPAGGIPSSPPPGCSGCTWMEIAGPNKGMGGGNGIWVQDNAGAEEPAAPQDLGHADPSESGQGQSQTTPRPAGVDKAAPAEGAAPQPTAGASPPTPDFSTAPISAPGGGAGPPTVGRGGGPQEGGSRQAPGGSEAGRGSSGGWSGGGPGNLGILAAATTQIRDTSSFWETALQVAVAVTPGPGTGEGLLGLGVRLTSWAKGLSWGAARGAGHGYATRILGGGTGRAFAGHGELRFGAGTTTIPEGTTLTMWTSQGRGISDATGRLIEAGRYGEIPFAEGAVTWLSGSQVPNYVLKAPSGLTIMSNSITVESATPLSTLLRSNMGHLDWAACLLCR